jgi:hypothetical protein
MNRVAILQSNYIPWKGYFDIIHDVDSFIFYDDVQFTKNDWRNRNKIKTANGTRWLSIPVGTSAGRLVCEVSMQDSGWQRSHWDSLRQQYDRSAFFRQYKTTFEEIYLGTRWLNLSELNQHLIRRISRDILNISTKFRDSREFALTGNKLDRLLDLVAKCGATSYISGPAARDYVIPERFDEMNVELVWKDYSGYPEYSQAHPPFDHAVSILDLLFNEGPEAARYIWGWRDEKVRS